MDTSNLAGLRLPDVVLGTAESWGGTAEFLVTASEGIIFSTFVQGAMEVMDVGLWY